MTAMAIKTDKAIVTILAIKTNIAIMTALAIETNMAIMTIPTIETDMLIVTILVIKTEIHNYHDCIPSKPAFLPIMIIPAIKTNIVSFQSFRT